jgi:hypothetical protein
MHFLSTPLGAPPYATRLSTCCPFALGSRLVDHLLQTHDFSAYTCGLSPLSLLSYSLANRITSHHPVQTIANWASAYAQDPATCLILSLLAAKITTPLTKATIAVATAYREYLREDRISLADGKLVVFHPVQNNTEFLMLIVVPSSLCHDVFSAYHASPSAGHMGVYKTLHRIRLHFFWPFCRRDVTAWVLQCSHCIAINGFVSRNSELVFSWPLCCPFYILHVNLWAPGDVANYRGDTYLLNAMCDLTGFVIINAVRSITAANLAHVFVQEVLLKIGFLCGLVVVDDGSTFKGLFQSVCTLLGITFHAATRGNHKAVGVEHFHRFLNKAVGITTQDREFSPS